MMRTFRLRKTARSVLYIVVLLAFNYVFLRRYPFPTDTLQTIFMVSWFFLLQILLGAHLWFLLQVDEERTQRIRKGSFDKSLFRL